MPLKCIYFDSHTFCNREIKAALARRNDLGITNVVIPYRPPASAVDQILEQLKPQLPALIISLNNGGFDYDGNLCAGLASRGCYQINWYYDDPLFDRVIFNAKVPDSRNRVDFVSEDSLVPVMQQMGFNSAFLPLATDPGFFNMKSPVAETRDVAFVGNSSLEFIEKVLGNNVNEALVPFASLLNDLKRRYIADTSFNIRKFLLERPGLWQGKTSLGDDLFLFAAEWSVGYFHRRDFVTTLAEHYKKRFTCFGDIYWTKFIDKELVSTDARYYSTLCDYYRSTRVNININRIQIRTAFTQRIFDCKACGAFLLTDRRLLNGRYFTISGPDAELIEFSDVADCKKKIDYYLTHEDERRRIAMAGRDKVLREHTYDQRLEQMLAYCKKLWKI